MKQTLYIISFGFLGLLVTTVIHAVVEVIALDIIFNNPKQYADTFWWQEWDLIHGVFAFGLWGIGLMGGLYLGVRWWKPYGSKKGLFGIRKKQEN